MIIKVKFKNGEIREYSDKLFDEIFGKKNKFLG